MDGIDVIMQSRIEGVALAVAWPYLTLTQKNSFKNQARQIVQMFRTLKGPPQYVVVDNDPVVNKGITQQEADILFPPTPSDLELGFSHNDLQPSNIIVKDDKIVGIIDWEMAGFFGERAGQVHQQLRTPARENYLRLGLSEERLGDLTFWNDLYKLEGEA